MRSGNWFTLFAFVATLSGGLLSCDGGDGGGDNTCADPCSCWGECPNGDRDGAVRPDGDARPDRDGDAAVQYGSLTVTATAAGAEVNADINLNGNPTGYQTPHTFTSLPVGAHSVLLSYPGRLQAPNPAEVNITTEGAPVNIVLYRDLTGRWRRESDGEEMDVRMIYAPRDYGCPDTEVSAGPFQPLGSLCVEADDTLSLCKTHAPECAGYWAEGRLLSDGRRVEFCELRVGMHYPDDCVAPYPLVYAKID